MLALDLKPDDLIRMAQKSNEMSYTQLRRYVEKVTAEGYDATTYKVDMYGKLAFPFICVIMALTGAATGMRGFVKNNLPVGIAVGVVFCFFVLVCFRVYRVTGICQNSAAHGGGMGEQPGFSMPGIYLSDPDGIMPML